MKKISIEMIKKLREETGAGVMEVKKALEESAGDRKKALDWIKKKGLAKVEKRADKEARQGRISSYVHHGGRVASMVEIACETDFVGKTEEFGKLGQEISMQVASMNPKDVKSLLIQEYIRDPKKKISDLVSEVASKTGEKIELKRFVRYQLGKK